MYLLCLATLVSVAAAAAPPPPPGAPKIPEQNEATQKYLDELNKSLANNYLYALVGVCVALLAYSVVLRLNAHLRHLASMNNSGTLRYFSEASPHASLAKSKLLYAPLLHYRRAREIKFSDHVNMGTLPSRFQGLFIVFMILTNIFASVWNIPWNDNELQWLQILRNRTGTLATVNLLPLMLLATVKNPLIYLLDISYDTFNLMHRWIGRVAVLEAIVHTLCWIIFKVKVFGWAGVQDSMTHSPFIISGLVALVGFVVILLQSPKVFRSMAYEFFLHFHFVLVVMSFVFLWRHLTIEKLPQLNLLLGAVIIWSATRAWRLATLVYRSFGRGGSKAKIDSLDGGAVRISIKTARPWTYRPGQSLYLTIPAIGLWTSHPFSVAWSGIEDPVSQAGSARSSINEKAPIVRESPVDVDAQGEHRISLIVKKHKGLTHQLWKHAEKCDGTAEVSAYVEGPYGNERSLSSYGTVMLFASGVGITHQLGYVKHLVEGFGQGTVAARRVTLVWVIPSTECLDWIRPWMHEVLSMEGRREVLKVLLYITRAALSQEIRSPSETVRMSRGRPDVESLILGEAAHKVGCMGVSVCAGGGLADEVRRASRLAIDRGVNLDFNEEGFGW